MAADRSKEREEGAKSGWTPGRAQCSACRGANKKCFLLNGHLAGAAEKKKIAVQGVARPDHPEGMWRTARDHRHSPTKRQKEAVPHRRIDLEQKRAQIKELGPLRRISGKTGKKTTEGLSEILLLGGDEQIFFQGGGVHWNLYKSQ